MSAAPNPTGKGLKPGAGGGPQPNSGRPSSEVRDRCKGSFWERIKVAEEIIDNPESMPSDRLRGLDLLGKYGGLTQVDVTSGDQPLTRDEATARLAALMAARLENHDKGD